MPRMELDDEICLCFHVTKRKILSFLRVERPRRLAQMSECFGAGTGCGWCRPFLRRYFEEAVQAGGAAIPPAPGAPPAAAGELSPDEYARQRSQYVRRGGGIPPPGATPLVDEPDG